jgi:tyrosine-protein phosphatase YwqE
MRSTMHLNKRKVVHSRVRAPESVCEHEDVTLLWNQEVHTDREVIANRPNIIINSINQKTCMLIEVEITADRYVMRKEQKVN